VCGIIYVEVVMKALISVRSKAMIAMERLRRFEPEEPYWVAYSGGKDSQAILHLVKESGCKYEAHYNLTTVDPPELVRFIREQYPEVVVDRPEKNMWELIEKEKVPPTRLMRYCCRHLKERGGVGRVVVTGVRWQESTSRAKQRGLVELNMGGNVVVIGSDSSAVLDLYRSTPIDTKHVINPIIDWSASEVWQYLALLDVPHCCLYDEGFKRIGCVGCPQGGPKQMKRDFERWPKYRANYVRAFDRMLERRRESGLVTQWTDGEDVMKWWIGKC
jgi:phosphoadenosine phosphosulfate reductase